MIKSRPGKWDQWERVSVYTYTYINKHILLYLTHTHTDAQVQSLETPPNTKRLQSSSLWKLGK